MILGPDTKMMFKLRGNLIKDIIKHDNEVTVVVFDDKYKSELEKDGSKVIVINAKRTSLNPFNDVKLFFLYKKIIKSEKVDVVFSYSIKPVLYGSIAAKCSKIKDIFALMPGLGYAFKKDIRIMRLISPFINFLYKKAFKYCDKVFIQNKEDKNDLINRKLLKNDKCVLINGSGVDLQKFNPEPMPEKISFIMISRLLHDKGVIEYLKASELIKKKYPKVQFKLAGAFDSNPKVISKNELDYYTKNDIVSYLGEMDDVTQTLKDSSALVLPTYYQEGIPRIILEAMAMSRPVLTTDWRGCNFAVVNNFTGILVPIKDYIALSKKMEWMIKNPKKVEIMGQKGRKRAVEFFDVNNVNQVILKNMKLTK